MPTAKTLHKSRKPRNASENATAEIENLPGLRRARRENRQRRALTTGQHVAVITARREVRGQNRNPERFARAAASNNPKFFDVDAGATVRPVNCVKVSNSPGSNSSPMLAIRRIRMTANDGPPIIVPSQLSSVRAWRNVINLRMPASQTYGNGEAFVTKIFVAENEAEWNCDALGSVLSPSFCLFRNANNINVLKRCLGHRAASIGCAGCAK
jgi:hypothetical protein